ncbi:SH2B adapter protein 1-like [Anthonomus grandis grandis]|uniref:SH2B adapter protein 1-like n=1 Tax=Anthonomus grandis grandis TaxID=2921223 RepID=UPI0021669E5F|nr:SH2B adapter protein 1-like [Anthonomus grandis grandis]
MATALESTSPEKAWVEFCERHATAAAQDFSKSCHNYINICLPENARTLVNHKDLMKKFIEFFTEEFDRDFNRRRLGGNKCLNGMSGGTAEDNFDTEDGSPKMAPKPFFRRLSFKMLRKSKDLFHKHSEEDNISHNKTKLAKIVVECRKEGIVNYTTPECLDQPSGPPKWERCRLQLVKATGGYMLEFYSPPKNPKPRSGVFCALIIEARETTALEMPDHENTFVLKASNNMEFVIEAHDTDDMRSWLATIRYCMSRNSIEHTTATIDYQSNAPDLPPRHMPGTRGVDRLSSSSNFDICPNPGETHTIESDIGQTLKKELWFHGMLPRSEATQQVLHDGAAGHGRFLVRQSETRTGEFVLTFNFQGRPKHLRMTINENGQCRLQHYWFQSIYEMLENFRTRPIPLESGGNSDVTLTDYILNPNARQQLQHSGSRPIPVPASAAAASTPMMPNQGGAAPTSNGAPETVGGAGRRAPIPVPEVRQVITHNGSVRTQEAVQELQSEQTPNRAVENQYSFV